MTTQELIQKLTSEYAGNQVFSLQLSSELTVEVYPKSINQVKDDYLFLGKSGTEKYFFIISRTDENSIMDHFQGKSLHTAFDADMRIKQGAMTHENAAALRELFAFTRPILIGLQDSFGFGDRLGLANPAHLRAVQNSHMKPVLAQQSVRELNRTQRKPEEVMDAATWAVYQEGFKAGFGADADHLMTTEDIDSMVQAGFTMFTFDPGAHVVNEADSLPMDELLNRAKSNPWQFLQDTYENFVTRYEDKLFEITEDFNLRPDREQVLRALIKYGGVIAHTLKLYRHLKKAHPHHPAEVELSVDETEAVTSPFEHFLVVSELKRRGIQLVSLAPRFVGEFEKGIDFKGNLHRFREEYIKHVKIAQRLGPYKISIHSGSDKFSVYENIGSLAAGCVHVKTAGTSYLEALRTVAAVKPSLFRGILEFARNHYEVEKVSYHVSAQLEKVPPANELTDAKLLELFEQDDARQVLHVTFGKVLTSKNSQGTFEFRDRLLECLKKHEDTHYRFLLKHFQRHLKPFNNKTIVKI